MGKPPKEASPFFHAAILMKVRTMAPLLILALALTGAFLAGPARARMDSATSVVLLLHLGLGVLMAPVLLMWGLRFRGVRGRGSGVEPKTGAGRPNLSPLAPDPRPLTPVSISYWLLAAALLTGIALIVVA